MYNLAAVYLPWRRDRGIYFFFFLFSYDERQREANNIDGKHEWIYEKKKDMIRIDYLYLCLSLLQTKQSFCTVCRWFEARRSNEVVFGRYWYTKYTRAHIEMDSMWK